MDMSGMIGLAQTGMQMPLQYGNMYQQGYSPLFQYYGNQAGNVAGLGNQFMGQMGNMGQGSMNLYGNMAQHMMDAQQFNAVAPALKGLLAGSGYNIDFGQMDINPVMQGYNDAVGRAYGGVQGAYNQSMANQGRYDQPMQNAFTGMMGMMPRAPYMEPPKGNKKPTFGVTAPTQYTQWQPPAPKQQTAMPPQPYKAPAPQLARGW